MTHHRQHSSWLSRLLDVVFPQTCLISQGLVEDDAPLAHLSRDASQHGIFPIQAPYCHRCGQPFLGVADALQECPNCAALDPKFDHGRSLIRLLDAGRTLIHELKYHGGRYVCQDVMQLMRANPDYSNFLEGGVLVPVPLHKRRQRWRGFNQSALLADVMAEVTGCPVQALLKRHRHTQTQTHLNRSQRKRNIRGAFSMASPGKLNPDLRYVLVDDVFTTGATLNECARVMRRNGARSIDIATIAHG